MFCSQIGCKEVCTYRQHGDPDDQHLKQDIRSHVEDLQDMLEVPKKNDARVIQQYRPICLLNTSFKIFTKVATNRLTSIAQKLVRPTQTAFLPGRNIMEGAVILHETLHELNTKKTRRCDF